MTINHCYNLNISLLIHRKKDIIIDSIEINNIIENHSNNFNEFYYLGQFALLVTFLIFIIVFILLLPILVNFNIFYINFLKINYKINYLFKIFFLVFWLKKF